MPIEVPRSSEYHPRAPRRVATPRLAKASLLDASRRAFLDGPVAINLASRNDDLVPSIARGYGCRVSGDGRRVKVFLAEARAQALLRDLRAGGPIAVVFSRPNTHETLQLKAAGAEVMPIKREDRGVMRRYGEIFFAEIVALGYDDAFTSGLVSGVADEAVAVSFEPSAAFEQTPGPRAGQRLAVAE
jgi:hypothetical protein